MHTLLWDNSIMHSGSIYSHINSWYRYFGMSLNLRTDGEATDGVLNYKRSCGCQVHASCAVRISNRIVQAVTRSSNSRIRTEVEKGNVITGAGKVEHCLIRLICYSPCCDNWTSIRPSVGSKRQHSYECHCYQKSSHWWVPHDHDVSTAARLCTWTTELAGFEKQLAYTRFAVMKSRVVASLDS